MKETLYVWFDTEFSTLELEDAALLQVAALITDASLHRVLPHEDDVRCAIRLPRGAGVSRWVEENLPGLVDACRSAGAVSPAEADERLAAYVDRAADATMKRDEERPVLAGNSIHMDWWLARRFLPRFLSRLHYRHFDVTAFKLEWKRRHRRAKEFDKEDSRLVLRYFPEADLSGSGSRHDAYYDAQASCAELAFYRQHLFMERKQGRENSHCE